MNSIHLIRLDNSLWKAPLEYWTGNHLKTLVCVLVSLENSNSDTVFQEEEDPANSYIKNGKDILYNFISTKGKTYLEIVLENYKINVAA